jgi:hypothetical protein
VNPVKRIALGLDQLGNTLLGGDPDETISSTLGKLKDLHGGRIPWQPTSGGSMRRLAFPIARIVDAGLDLIDPGHSQAKIEKDRGEDDSREFAEEWRDLQEKVPPPKGKA